MNDLKCPEAEESFVGSLLMLSPQEPVLVLGADVAPSDLHDEHLGATVAAVRDLVRAGGYVDMVTVHEELQRRGVDMPFSRLASLVQTCPNPYAIGEYAKVIADKAARRAALAHVQQATKAIYNRNGDWRDHVAAVGVHLATIDETPKPEAENPATWADMATMIGPVAWEWADWLPSGLLIELVADSGAGKSAVALRIAATYLRGWMWPDGTPYIGATGKVLWCEAEAGQAVNLERAQAWGLPLESILSPLANPLDDVSLFDDVHLAAITAKAARDDVRLIVVDSLSGGTAGREKGEDQMPVVKWLAELARNLGKPVLLLHHLRKRGLSDGGDVVTLDRVRGSTVIVQPARVVWALDVPNPNTLDHKRLSVIKSNLGRFPKSIGVRIDDGGLTFGEAPQVPKTMTKLDQAKLLLLRVLAGGPRLQSDIESDAILEGISMDTMREAKKRLGCKTSRDGHTGKWSWDLPDNIGGQDGGQDEAEE